jgi:signal transduction histidine kinase
MTPVRSGRASAPRTPVLAAQVAVTVVLVLAVEVGWLQRIGSPAPLWTQLTIFGLVGAFLVSRWHPTLAMALLIVDAATVMARSAADLDQAGGLVSVAGVVAALVGTCWVTCVLGLRTDLRWALPWLAGWVAVVIWRLDTDAPLLMLSLGWWAVGQAIRSHQILAGRLEARAEDLRGEQQRFAAEAVRLERARIARELHDVVAHSMTVIVIQARAGQQLLDRDPVATRETLDAVGVAVAQAREDVAALVSLMEPGRPRPLTQTVLDELVERARATGSVVDLTVHGDPDGLPHEVAVAAHHVVQEALTNAFRYAPGAAVAIELSCWPPVTLEVVNTAPPTGSELTGLGAGRGLTGLAERLAGSEMTLDWGPTVGRGWRVRVSSAPTVDVDSVGMAIQTQ